MASTVEVLSARARVEEKQILTALDEAGVPACLLPPADAPLPICPAGVRPAAATGAAGLATGPADQTPTLIVDRCANRTIAGASLPVLRALGALVLDAGIAATGTRSTIAAALAAAGVPRPVTYLVASEESGLAALDALGYPATYLPLLPASPEIALLDRDTAEAVFEHRGTLGGAPAAVGILQAGTTIGRERVAVIVVGGAAVAVHDPAGTARHVAPYIAIAEAAARALAADIAGVELIATAAGPLVWDINPVPDFRDATPLGWLSAGAAIADLAQRRLRASIPAATQLMFGAFETLGEPFESEELPAVMEIDARHELLPLEPVARMSFLTGVAGLAEEVTDGVVLSA